MHCAAIEDGYRGGWWLVLCEYFHDEGDCALTEALKSIRGLSIRIVYKKLFVEVLQCNIRRLLGTT